MYSLTQVIEQLRQEVHDLTRCNYELSTQVKDLTVAVDGTREYEQLIEQLASKNIYLDSKVCITAIYTHTHVFYYVSLTHVIYV